MNFYRLTSDNFLMYAVKSYSNPNASGTTDFNKDMKTFVYIKKLLNKMDRAGVDEINPQLLVNHVITLVNLFGPEPTSRMMLSYFDDQQIPSVMAILDYLNILPDQVPEHPDLNRIEMNTALMSRLEEL